MLMVFGGLPGVGKTTIAREVARQSGAVFLRIDTIEYALRQSGRLPNGVEDAGYLTAYAVAEDNLRAGRLVVADCVNPLAITRDAWRALAARAGARILEVEVACSDRAEHRRRVETRGSDFPGWTLTWQEVVERNYEPWDREHLVLETAGVAPEENSKTVLASIVPGGA